MMKKVIFPVFFSLLLLMPASRLVAQNSASTFDTTNFPQWAKDLRRWDIIAFGSFPFTMFTVTFCYDMYRWNNENRLDMSENSRKYAPWPLKSAGAVEMTKEEYERTMMIAAGLAATIAITDLIIVKVKKYREQRRIQSIPTGSATINKRPYQQDEEVSDEPEPE